MSTCLPVELIDKTFCQLPTKSLIRFKSVSKSCRDIIESTCFINSYHKRAPERILILKYDKKIYSFDIELGNLDQYDIGNRSFDYFVGSCNGLVCLFDVNNDIVICNVATREHLVIPYPSSSNADDRKGYGFGYDSIGDDYKVVLFENFYGSDNEYSVSMVYSLKKNKWTRSLHARYSFRHDKGMLVNGLMHWGDSVPKRGIVAFDLHIEVFCAQVPVPKELTRLVSDVGVLEGCICLSDDLGVWMMKDYMIKDSWTKLYTVRPFYSRCASIDDFPLSPLSNGCMY